MSNELLELLRELEWSATTRPVPPFKACPICRGIKPCQPHADIYYMESAIGHKSGCKLHSTIVSLEAQEPFGHVFHDVFGDPYFVDPCDPEYGEGFDVYRRPAIGAVPEGWQLVPVEPTQEMLDAAIQDGVCVDGKPVWKKDVVFQAKWKYQQMLAAAPQQGGGEDE